MRVGIGYDVHRFEEGKKLMLGGIEIPFEKGLKGHSDGDVLIHALIDGILGAAGLGDIGEHFPDTDVAYKEVDSKILLKRVLELVSEHYVVNNVDCIVVTERPKLSPYKDRIRTSLAELLGVSKERVNVKAKTEEGLGFTGREEGIKAYAVVLLEERY
ncbi:2-C-methyl-D-erythritol 2,4-cyclodiphosphate synthase [Caldanaerobacter subterraneus subsp. tengcongensis MB4]|nr:2-C-methyl-D-erythritol 2,4-cyclodiphosphate synthase [Caldanaerobacter subterraneus subsp. tengcongensis MB4]NNG66280.1 2-C-methyl-D-erythritol 2,4-cyclodiphosphate synthase [Caldanaerobacter subterraneus]